MKEICPKGDCTGCMACLNKCNSAAIVLMEDELGFRYPKINEGICIDCGLCHKACPAKNRVELHQPIRALVANAKDSYLQKSCTSGGMATILAKEICEQGGVVYGCTGADCSNIRHIRVENIEELDKLKGSKYVQSDIGFLLKSLRADLISGRQVLFIGTPCQVAGVYAFLGKSYDNLFTADFVCHGVPSQRLLNDAIKSYGIEPSSSYSVSFRSKPILFKILYGVNIMDEVTNEVKFSESFPKNNYITGFLQGLYYRESCYRCCYAKLERSSDITLGDYGDKDNKFTQLNRKDILSMVLINTSKGNSIFESISEKILFAPTTPQEFTSHNAQLRKPMPLHRKREEFIAIYTNKGFVKASEESLREDRKRIKKNIYMNNLREIIVRTPILGKLFKLIRGK